MTGRNSSRRRGVTGRLPGRRLTAGLTGLATAGALLAAAAPATAGAAMLTVGSATPVPANGALRTSLVRYRLPGGRSGFANSRAPEFAALFATWHGDHPDGSSAIVGIAGNP